MFSERVSSLYISLMARTSACAMPSQEMCLKMCFWKLDCLLNRGSLLIVGASSCCQCLHLFGSTAFRIWYDYPQVYFGLFLRSTFERVPLFLKNIIIHLCTLVFKCVFHGSVSEHVQNFRRMKNLVSTLLTTSPAGQV